MTRLLIPMSIICSTRGLLLKGIGAICLLSLEDHCKLPIFYTHYTTLPHNLIKEKLTELIEQTFNRKGSLYLVCNEKHTFFTSEQPKRYNLWSCQRIFGTLNHLLDNMFIGFGWKLYRQIVGILMVTNCATLVADLFLFCYERYFMDVLFVKIDPRHLNIQ